MKQNDNQELYLVSTDLVKQKHEEAQAKPLWSLKKVQEVPSMLLSDSFEEQLEETQVQKACKKFRSW